MLVTKGMSPSWFDVPESVFNCRVNLMHVTGKIRCQLLAFVAFGLIHRNSPRPASRRYDLVDLVKLGVGEFVFVYLVGGHGLQLLSFLLAELKCRRAVRLPVIIAAAYHGIGLRSKCCSELPVSDNSRKFREGMARKPLRVVKAFFVVAVRIAVGLVITDRRPKATGEGMVQPWLVAQRLGWLRLLSAERISHAILPP